MLEAFGEKLASKAPTSWVNGLISDTNACYTKSKEACRAVDHLVNMGSITKIVLLEHELQEMASCTMILEDTPEKALAFVSELSEYVSKLLALGMPTCTSLRFIFARDTHIYLILILCRIVPGEKNSLLRIFFFAFRRYHGAERLLPLPWPVL